MYDVNIKVVKIVQHSDLMTIYENPIEHTCDMQVGMEFLSVGGQKPANLCDSAWQVMKEFVQALANGSGNFFDGWMKNPYSAMISCNDGFRPVSFYIERLEKVT